MPAMRGLEIFRLNNYPWLSASRKTIKKLHGIRPPQHKREGKQLPPGKIKSDTFHIPITNTQGEPLKLLVKPGDRVLGGQFINQVRNPSEKQKLAPTSGIISEVGKVLIGGRVPYYSRYFKLEADGKNEMQPPREDKDYHTCSQDEILDRIKRAGIYGMGGAGFPSWRKISSGNITHLIVNGVECEPYITADHCIIEEHSAEIISAISLVQEIVSQYNIPDSDIKLETYIALEDNMNSAIELLRMSLRECPLKETYIRVLPTVYPAGSEKQLISSLLNKEVPVGQVMIQQGVLCLNIATIWAIYRAVVHNQPMLRRLVTIAGDAVQEARNYWIDIGTPIKRIIEEVKLKDPDNIEVFLGGGMMNYKIEDANMPISSSTNCLLFFIKGTTTNGETLFYKRNNSSSLMPDKSIQYHRECIRCGMCEDVCPVNLLPQDLYLYIRADRFDLAEENDLFSCIECAACDYVCPSNIPLSDYYTFAKEHLKAEKQSTYRADRARDRFNDHKDRIEKQKEELKQRRAARLAQMKSINNNSSAEELDIKQRKIASIKIQIDKTEQAMEKWEKRAKEDPEGVRVAALTQTLTKLKKELDELQEPSP